MSGFMEDFLPQIHFDVGIRKPIPVGGEQFSTGPDLNQDGPLQEYEEITTTTRTVRYMYGRILFRIHYHTYPGRRNIGLSTNDVNDAKHHLALAFAPRRRKTHVLLSVGKKT